jgi:hypothetical protein
MPAPSMPVCLIAALDYLQRGWSAVPLCPPDHADVPGAHEKTCTQPGKHPLWDWHPYQERLPRSTELQLLWARNRHQNVGIILGPVSGLIAIDIDGSAGEQQLLELSGGDLPATLEFTTPECGRCLLYRWPDTGATLRTFPAEGPGATVRILARGSLAIMPPSRHQCGGTYAWVPGHRPGEIEPAPCPRWLFREAVKETGEQEDKEKQPASMVALPPCLPVPVCPSGARAQQRRFADVVNKPVAWLWPNWIPLGKLTLLDGDPGLGKSTLLLDLAARVSRQGVMPDAAAGVSGHVVILSAEDGAEDTIRPRLEAAGAALDRVHGLSHVLDRGVERCLEIPRDLPLIEQQVEAVDARLLLIDPLAAFLHGSDANKDHEIRRVLYQLSRFAERRRCACLCMRHLNKGNSSKALYRGNMSIGVIGHARAGLLVAPDPDDAVSRILAVTKCNLAARPASLRFRLEPRGAVCRIDWNGTSPYHADQLLQAPASAEDREAREETVTKRELCAALLRELLGQGAVEIRQLKKECAAAGLSNRTVERAARRLGLRLTHAFVQGRNRYTWELP